MRCPGTPCSTINNCHDQPPVTETTTGGAVPAPPAGHPAGPHRRFGTHPAARDLPYPFLVFFGRRYLAVHRREDPGAKGLYRRAGGLRAFGSRPADADPVP